MRSNSSASRSAWAVEVAPNSTSFDARSHSTGVHLRRLNRPSLASACSRSRALSLASRFCFADANPLGLSLERAVRSAS